MAGPEAAATALRKGTGVRKARVRTSVHFYRPKTYKPQRAEKYKRKAVPKRQKMDKFRVIKCRAFAGGRLGRLLPDRLRQLRSPSIWSPNMLPNGSRSWGLRRKFCPEGGSGRIRPRPIR